MKKAIKTPASADARRVFLLEFETRHFSFMTLADTRADAIKQLIKGWAAHCAQYPGADLFLVQNAIRADELEIREVAIGAVYRDGSELDINF